MRHLEDNEKLLPTNLNSNIKFIKIASHPFHDLCAALSENEIYYIWGNCGEQEITEQKETDFKSFDDIFEFYLKVNYKAIKGKVISFEDRLTHDGKYENEFIELEKIGEGSYGVVYNVKITDEEKYAIKKD